MIDANITPSISTEANLVKGNFSINIQDRAARGIIRRIREAIDPVAAAQIYTDAAKIVSEGISVITQDLIKAGTPRHLASTQAYEIYRGAVKLTHLSQAFEYAESYTDDIKEYNKPSDEFINNYTSAVEEVNDDEILRMFGKVLAGEMESPGKFSKKTLSILKNMNSDDAKAFEKLCAHSIGGEYINENGESAYFFSRPFLLPNENGSSYNCEKISLEEVRCYETLGLVLHDMYDTFPLMPGVGQLIVINGTTYEAQNLTDEKIQMHLGAFMFSKWGAELATLCDLGTAPEVLKLTGNVARAQGLEFFKVDLNDDNIALHYTRNFKL